MDKRYQPIYTIGEAAKQLGVVVPFLRILEKTNLLLTARSEYGKRLYSQCDIEYIRVLLDLGLKQNKTIDEIIRSVEGLRCWEILECEAAERSNCLKYLNVNAMCWMREDVICEGNPKKCRECTVYRSLYELLPEQLSN
ncbi:MAG: MerR family transcriptional regulator [candidate division Zixibacteria bacterium]|nr:MerR family transcriptional regulator [Candidatus Tariuqbacter arcticus]